MQIQTSIAVFRKSGVMRNLMMAINKQVELVKGLKIEVFDASEVPLSFETFEECVWRNHLESC